MISLNHQSFLNVRYGRLAFAEWRNPSHDVDQWIHPVLRSEMWINLTDPVLDDPLTLNYFHALSVPAASMDTISHVSSTLTADCKIMDIPDTLSPDQQRAVFQKLCAMRNFTHWRFENDDTKEATAFTDPITNAAGEYIVATKPQTAQSRILIRKEIFRVLEYYAASVDPDDERYSRIIDDTYMMAGIHTSRRAPINHISAIYRTGYLLAATLLHEFTHAFAMAYFEIPHTSALDNIYEPWVRGNRANEQGWSFEDYTFGGVINSHVINVPPLDPDFTSYLQSFTAPFGFSTLQQWDVWMTNDSGYGHVMDSDYGDAEYCPPGRLFPVPQAWVHWIYSDDLWKNQVHRFGLSVLKVPRLQEWEMVIRCEGAEDAIGSHRTGEDRWNTGQVCDHKPNWD